MLSTLLFSRNTCWKGILTKSQSLPEAPRWEESPEVQEGAEMATLHRHLVNNLRALKENNPKVGNFVTKASPRHIIHDLKL